MQKENNVIKTKFENHTTNQIKKVVARQYKRQGMGEKGLNFLIVLLILNYLLKS